jgi:hypothetical protein
MTDIARDMHGLSASFGGIKLWLDKVVLRHGGSRKIRVDGHSFKRTLSLRLFGAIAYRVNGRRRSLRDRNLIIDGSVKYAVHSRRNLLRDCRRCCRPRIAVAGSQAARTMIAGHFGFAAGVKAAEPQTPLWALMLATVWLDIVFVPLLLAGVETLQPAAGTHGGYGENIIHADYTHSLVGAAALSVVFGMACGSWWKLRSGVVLGLVSFSHWLLDLLVHRADMPLLPGDIGHFSKFGFGLWRVPQTAIAIEAFLVVVGAWLYWRAARSVSKAAGRRLTRAIIASLLIAIGGIGVLVLDVTAVLG